MSDSWTYANYQPYQQRHYTDQKNDYRVRSNSNGQAPGKWWKQGQAVKLFVCCILGIAVGVGHHMYYSYLDGREASNQSWIIRSGTAIAFLSKLLFSTSIGVAFPQLVWQTLRCQPLSIGAIDALFALRGEASSFFNGEMIAHAKSASLIATAGWSLALVPILVSGSISVTNSVHTQLARGVPVQNLNFSRPLTDVQYNGTTPLFTLQLANTVGMGAAPWQYVEPSHPASSFVSNTLYGKRMIEAPSPCGANCSFSQSFTGPAYKCDDVDFTRNETIGNPFCMKSSAGHGDCGGAFDPIMTFDPFTATWYAARNSSGDLCSEFSGETYDICSASAEPWKEGKLWVMYQYLLPQYRNTDADGRNMTPIPDEAWERHQFVCQSYNATYSLNRTYRNFLQTVDGTLSYLNPINFTARMGADQSSTENYPAWVIHQSIFSLLNGSIEPNGRFVETDTTGLAMSALVQDLPFPLQSRSGYRSVMAQKPIQFLRQAILDLHFNVTVGLLSLAPQLLYSQTIDVEVETRNAENIWSYDWRVLVATYGAAAIFDIVAVILGIRAMSKNGGSSQLGFSRTVATTRANHHLDDVIGAWSHGMDPVPEHIKKTRIVLGQSRGPSPRVEFVRADR